MKPHPLASVSLLLVLLAVPAARAQAPAAEVETLHPALFLVGDSITRTGVPPGDKGPWGMGYEIIPLFDAAKIHVYNLGLGGRSSRGYIAEGAWAKALARMQPGDFVLIMFGHNDSANSANYPDRTTITGTGDEQIQIGVRPKNEIVHTYGWYLRQYASDAKAKGATPILCSPVPRDQWVDGKIKRGFDGYAGWAADAARQSGALFIDLNTLAADRYDALGEDKAKAYFNDFQHPRKIGAKLLAAAVADGIRGLKGCPLAGGLLPPSP